jgi:hypothetical protein
MEYDAIITNKKVMYKILVTTATLLKTMSVLSSYFAGSVQSSTFNIMCWSPGVKDGFFLYNGFAGAVYAIFILFTTFSYLSEVQGEP